MTENLPPDWVLERYLLGELSSERVSTVDLEDPETSARLEALRADNKRVLEAFPPRVVAAAVEQRARRTQRSLWASVLAIGTLVAVAGLVVLPADTEPLVEPPPQELGTRVKGERPQLIVHRETVGDPERLDDGAKVREGDVIQLAFTRGDDRHGVLVSLDGAGVVTTHLPTLPASPDGGAVALDFAYELDDAPDFERFVLVTSTDPVALSEVVAAARKVADGASPQRASLPLDPAFHQTSVLLLKE